MPVDPTALALFARKHGLRPRSRPLGLSVADPDPTLATCDHAWVRTSRGDLCRLCRKPWTGEGAPPYENNCAPASCACHEDDPE